MPKKPSAEKSALADVIARRLADIEARWLASIQKDIVHAIQVNASDLRDAMSDYLDSLANTLKQTDRIDNTTESKGAAAWA